jgi:hypothetical protein
MTLKEAKEKIKDEYRIISVELKDSNKKGFNDLYGKGLKAGLKIALEYLKMVKIYEDKS